MEKEYHYATIEKQAQTDWTNTGYSIAQEKSEAPHYYCLSMLPYPSGQLHMGHIRNYTLGDMIARFHRMTGEQVLQPIGWDSFGLPAENAAMLNKTAPHLWTEHNIATMKTQLGTMGFSFDWTRELRTSDPRYYRWEQWFLIQLFHRGLLYQKTTEVNWDPVDHTVLANEQVIDGRGWRSGALVEKKRIPIFFLRMTQYAEELYNSIDTLTQWPENVRLMQKNWIGPRTGYWLSSLPTASSAHITAFIERLDHLPAVSCIVLSYQHPWVESFAAEDPGCAAFIAAHPVALTEASEMKKARALYRTQHHLPHPLRPEESIPVCLTNYLSAYTDITAEWIAPAHDPRFYAVAAEHAIARPSAFDQEQAGPDQAEGTLGPIAGPWQGYYSEQAHDALCAFFEQQNRLTTRTHYRLRDWGISRQRYWGCPLPFVHCPQCGTVPVPEASLPVTLPEDLPFGASAETMAAALHHWRQTTCPHCHQPAEREVDTLDTFVESSWYFLRYCCPDADHTMLDERAHYWMHPHGVNQYIGGVEHAVLHLLYARFWHKCLRDHGLVRVDEPFHALLTQGMVLAPTFYYETDDHRRHWINPAHVSWSPEGQPIETQTGQTLIAGPIEKMSKSKNNGVEPVHLVERFGADTVRLFIIFAAPPEQSLEWSDQGLEGAHRFLKRLWRSVYEYDQYPATDKPTHYLDHVSQHTAADRLVFKQVQEAVRKAADEYSRRYQFNTIVAAAMKLHHTISDYMVAESTPNIALLHYALTRLLCLLSPITPHITHTLWPILVQTHAIEVQPFPTAEIVTEATRPWVIQVNGKKKTVITGPQFTQIDDIQTWFEQQTFWQNFEHKARLQRMIIVPQGIINLVIR